MRLWSIAARQPGQLCWAKEITPIRTKRTVHQERLKKFQTPESTSKNKMPKRRKRIPPIFMHFAQPWIIKKISKTSIRSLCKYRICVESSKYSSSLYFFFKKEPRDSKDKSRSLPLCISRSLYFFEEISFSPTKTT